MIVGSWAMSQGMPRKRACSVIVVTWKEMVSTWSPITQTRSTVSWVTALVVFELSAKRGKMGLSSSLVSTFLSLT
jgi:hypothetical protein